MKKITSEFRDGFFTGGSMEKRRFLSGASSFLVLLAFATAATARTTVDWKEARELFARMQMSHVAIDTMERDHCMKSRLVKDTLDHEALVRAAYYEPGFGPEVCGAIRTLHQALDAILDSETHYNETERSYVPASIKLLDKSLNGLEVFGNLICNADIVEPPLEILRDTEALDHNLTKDISDALNAVCVVLPEWKEVVREGSAADNQRWEEMQEEIKDAQGSAYSNY